MLGVIFTFQINEVKIISPPLPNKKNSGGREYRLANLTQKVVNRIYLLPKGKHERYRG